MNTWLSMSVLNRIAEYYIRTSERGDILCLLLSSPDYFGHQQVILGHCCCQATRLGREQEEVPWCNESVGSSTSLSLSSTHSTLHLQVESHTYIKAEMTEENTPAHCPIGTKLNQ